MNDKQTSATGLNPETAEQGGQPVAAEGAFPAIKATGKAGAPSKYLPQVVDSLLAAIGDGLTLKQACTAAGISESALGDWRERHPELNPRLEQAREQARQKALAGIKAAGEGGGLARVGCLSDL
jgi:hypothetical protein